jgi:hypothetical protein
MKDYLGKKLKIGDYVLRMIGGSGVNIRICVITAFTPANVRVNSIYTSGITSGKGTVVSPTNLIKTRMSDSDD